MNGQHVNTTKLTQDISWAKPIFTSQNNIESHLKGANMKVQRHSVFQCHLFTYFNLITFDEKKFTFPSNIGTYLLFRDDIEDFEVINKYDHKRLIFPPCLSIKKVFVECY